MQPISLLYTDLNIVKNLFFCKKKNKKKTVTSIENKINFDFMLTKVNYE